VKNIIYYLLISSVIFTQSSCTKDDAGGTIITPKQSGNSILGVSINSNVKFPAIIQIDSAKNTIYLNLSENYDISAITPKIIISTGATISPASGMTLNFKDPVSYTVKAENGITRTYIFIASLTKGQVVERFSTFTQATKLEAYQSYCLTNNNNNGNEVSITLGGCGIFDTGVRNLVYFTIKNKSIRDNLVGTYMLSATSPTRASVYANNRNYVSAIIDGTLTITKYDSNKRLISGSYTGNFYRNLLPHRNDETIFFSCEFTNAQL
jgi:hypothetical protein